MLKDLVLSQVQQVHPKDALHHSLLLKKVKSVLYSHLSALMLVFLGVTSVLAFASLSYAQSTAQAIAQYRAMLQDGNPAELFVDKGELLWREPRGPKQASLEKCDLGLGPGVLEGAWVQMPRYFKDTQRVQDLESRLLTCMQTLQGFDEKVIAKTPFGVGEQVNVSALAAFVSSKSEGKVFELPQAHEQERRFYEMGKRIFYTRAGPYDFSCSTCHSQTEKRIRLQDLPNLTTQEGAAAGFGAWPAYRVSNGQMWSMQQRLNDCFRQQRFPYPIFASDATIALGVFMGVNAKGAPSIAPALKR
jgi:L-cysteine S-thiosulfotransferase